MSNRSIVSGLAALAVTGLMASACQAAVLTPIAVTGFTQDVVYEVGATGSGNGGFISESGWSLSENGLLRGDPLAPLTPGLPTGGLLTSNVAGTTFQLAPYTGLNALDLYDSPSATYGTLTFATPAAYAQIAVLGLSTRGDSNFSMVITYTDGTNSSSNARTTGRGGVFDNQRLPDWFNETGGSSQNGSVAAATGDIYRVESSGGNDSGLGVNLQQFTYDLTAHSSTLYGTSNFVLSTKPIASIEFEALGGDRDRTFLAISGAEVPEPSSVGVALLIGLGALARRRHHA